MTKKQGEKTKVFQYQITEVINQKLEELLEKTHYRSKAAIIDQAIVEMHEKMTK